jgi:tagaturonate epimerase
MRDFLRHAAAAAKGAVAPSAEDAARFARLLSERLGLNVYPRSLIGASAGILFLGSRGASNVVGMVRTDAPPGLDGAEQTLEVDGQPLRVTTAAADSRSADRLRRLLPHLEARPLGLARSAGFGDRLGLATPGHIRAVRKFRMAPIFAQQSVRENERTGRSPRQVLDDALWGVFQEGWTAAWGADADHLKTVAHADAFAAAGYSFFTVDPGEHVDNAAGTAAPSELERSLQDLPWAELETTRSDLERTLCGRPLDLDALTVRFSPEDVMRAAAKYGRAVAHTVRLYRRLEQTMGNRGFEFEMSVDETDSPTSLAEHVYIASELRRMKVKWVSLAPRYVGTFEKGVDYIGDLAAFETSFAGHAAVARAYGPYKLSLHSGSDKFSIYPIAARLAGDLVHLKTAGTSYLEALRAVAALDPALFRAILQFGVERYPTDRASYHVSAETDRVPDASRMRDGDLAGLLDDFHAREVLHVTFGSVINDRRFREPFFEALRRHEEEYTRTVEAHFDRHLRLFGP